jgi:hypothetical protein
MISGEQYAIVPKPSVLVSLGIKTVAKPKSISFGKAYSNEVKLDISMHNSYLMQVADTSKYVSHNSLKEVLVQSFFVGNKFHKVIALQMF